jgi:hypothetical protein
VIVPLNKPHCWLIIISGAFFVIAWNLSEVETQVLHTDVHLFMTWHGMCFEPAQSTLAFANMRNDVLPLATYLRLKQLIRIGLENFCDIAVFMKASKSIVAERYRIEEEAFREMYEAVAQDSEVEGTPASLKNANVKRQLT